MAGRRIFFAAPDRVLRPCGPVFVLQGNGLQLIPAAHGLAPLTAAEQVAPDRPSRLRHCALRLRGVGAICGRCHNRRLPSLITSSATVARPCTVKARRAVAGDELKKDGGNETGPGFRANPTGKPKSRLRI